MMLRSVALPEYSPPASRPTQQGLRTGSARTEHRYSLERGTKHKWLTLVALSRAASPASLPLFYEGDVIEGRVELNLEKSEVIKAVTVSVQAGTTAVGQEEIRFLTIHQTLWPPKGGTGSDRMKDRYYWPFTITLPRKIVIADSNGSQEKGEYRLPPSFSERASPAYIDYRLKVNVKRGMLKVDQLLKVSFGYLPMDMPVQPSVLRRLAYTGESGLIGPRGDPDGWKVCEPVFVKGVLFNIRAVELHCTVAIAKPLCYAVGTTILIEVSVSSKDRQALDLLIPQSLRAYLVRSMAVGSDATEEEVTRRSNNFFQESVGPAYFWQYAEASSEEGNRVFRGEIEIPRDLKPSFRFPRFAIRYALEMLPFEVPGFVYTPTEPTQRLISEKIEIVTRKTPGIQTCSYAPPGYQKPQGGDYNKSMGLLENGNQRFYHHGR